MYRAGLRALRMVAGTVLVGASLATQAATLDFYCITGNDSGDCAIGESQLSVAVTNPGSDQVLFTFFNVGGDQATISGIYFDDGTLLGIALIDNSDPNVSFSQDATPPDLPGGNGIDPAFNVTAGFLADADSPAPTWGVSPGESVGILFGLQAGGSFFDILYDLYSGDLRIGLHVINFASGGSESFVNNPGGDPTAVIPVPAAVWLLGSGLLGLVAMARRRG